MRTTGIIHAELAAALTGLRHTDLFAVSDSGLPVPAAVPVIDLGITYGFPNFAPILNLILQDVTIEAAWASREVTTENPEAAILLTQTVHPELLDHETFKSRISACRFVVRTGEAKPYANVLLRAGVPWA
ncbi:D-ribose pyranase [Nocardia macrotermitis]|uniref:D-ribose pyranase n=1 Tax=Nocardia macrotermitis TaxID=2585198 RepID=A0A7K0D3I6_9NOCA|nr:D-ribose pyranase [Nocardia macrotermitis]MQY20296.1 D-ribose pyranase [Nocardia macrotermitis]